MAQFDVYRIGDGYVVDCQSNLMRHLATRLIIPLYPPDRAPKPADRLNPSFTLDGIELVLVTQFLGVVPLGALRDPAGSLAEHEYVIKSAIDMLVSGY